MTTKYWLVKQEPEDFSWEDFLREKRTAWTGVRNYQARNNLQAMCGGDTVLFYHSGDERRIVGLATVERTAYPDPISDEPGWVAVDLKAGRSLRDPVPLSAIKSDPALKDIALVRNSRLSVMPIPAPAFARIMKLAGS